MDRCTSNVDQYSPGAFVVDAFDDAGPDTPADAAVRTENQVVDKKIKSICKGC